MGLRCMQSTVSMGTYYDLNHKDLKFFDGRLGERITESVESDITKTK